MQTFQHAAIAVVLLLLYFTGSILAGGGPLLLQDEPDRRPWAESRVIGSRNSEQLADLPKSVHPIYYKLNLRPILEVGVFNTPGDVAITLECVEPTRSISINVNNIDVNHGSVRVFSSATEYVILGHEEDLNNHVYTVHLNGPLEVGTNYTLFMRFISQIPTSPLSGLYRSSYVNPTTGETHYLATTQFQSIGARRAFPCFDEPGIRSVFEISLGRRRHHHTLCNMEIRETVTDPDLPDWQWDHYNPTVVMPVYLIAIIVSDFTVESAPIEEMNCKRSSVWAAPHLIANARAGLYGAVTSARVINTFEQIFAARYDLPKLDSAGIPDFDAGAMENWGLVTYREYLILYVNGTNTESERRSVSSVISHELAHQWFGNLVTCATWAHIWLNEGFATFVSFWGMNATDPEYEPLDWIVADAYQPGMDFDAGPTSVPILNDGPNPSRIIYQKAGAVIRMMSFMLTDESFRNGLRRYLARHAYQPVMQDYLFQALTEQGHEDGTLDPSLTMKLIMDTWTHQSGFPLIEVTRLSSTHITFTQKSFGPNERKVNTTVLDPSELWYVPLSISSEALPGGAPPIWLAKNQTSLSYAIDTSRWILVNPWTTGFYRVLYDNYFANRLQVEMATNLNSVPPTSRSQILDDYFKFAFTPANYTTVARALDWTKTLSSETTLVTWLAFFNNMGQTFNYFSAHRAFTWFKTYYGEKVAAALRLIGEEQPASQVGDMVILRARLLDWDCAFGNDACRDYALKLYDEFSTDPDVNPVSPDLRAVMYCAMVSFGGRPALDFATTKFEDESDPTEKVRWRNALACPTELQEINEVLEVALGQDGIVTQPEGVALLQRLAMSPAGRPVLLSFIQDRFNDLITEHNTGGFRDIVSSLAGYLSESEDLASLQTLIEANTDGLESVMPALRTSLTRIEGNIAWMNSYGAEIAAWINQQ